MDGPDSGLPALVRLEKPSLERVLPIDPFRYGRFRSHLESRDQESAGHHQESGGHRCSQWGHMTFSITAMPPGISRFRLVFHCFFIHSIRLQCRE